jgi:hypothetical protein
MKFEICYLLILLTLKKNFFGVLYLKLGFCRFVFMCSTNRISVSASIKDLSVPARFNAKFSRAASFSPIATLATAFVNNCQICVILYVMLFFETGKNSKFI